jgi:hypothetical protein
MGRGIAAIEEEIRENGTKDDVECLEYVLRGTAGLHPREWEHSGGKKMDQFYEGAMCDERLGKSLDYFVQHEQVGNTGGGGREGIGGRGLIPPTPSSPRLPPFVCNPVRPLL